MKIVRPAWIWMLLLIGQPDFVREAAAAESDALNVILNRPAASSISLSLLPRRSLTLYCEYRPLTASAVRRTSEQTIQRGSSASLLLSDLTPDTPYTYRLFFRDTAAAQFTAGDEHFFHTARGRGRSFTFTVESDPHLYDKKGCAALMRIALQNQAQDHPDFMLDLGDTFGDDHNPFTITKGEIEQLHLNMRDHLGLVCHSIPFFFCIGNHEGEFGYYLEQTPPENIAVYATLARQRWFPNPVPDGFYSGNPRREAHGIGLPENYYAFEWGDALIVVLDAYRYFSGNAKPRGWEWTLGREQYDWLRQTLESSSAPYKFVFLHHILGQTRGGVAVAGGFEWGGKNQKGVDEFVQMRSGWLLPIHQLMVKHGVSILFQGHDHLYAREELDGIVYQEVPMPSDSTYRIGTTDNGDAFGGIKIDASGHLRVRVTPAHATVDYVRAWLPRDEQGGHRNGEVAYSYQVAPAASKPDTSESDSLVFLAQELLGRPTATSIALNFCTERDVEAWVDYGTASGLYTSQSDTIRSRGGVPATILLDQLQPATRYYYRLHCRTSTFTTSLARNEHTFTTQRSKGSTFSFAIEADPHLDANTDPELFRLTLQNIRDGGSDFFIDLGDHFMSEKKALITPETVLQRHLLLRRFYEQIGHSQPLFLALGNHEGEAGYLLDGSSECLPVWAANIRKQYFPNPQSDAFYSSSQEEEPFVGVRQSYYAWEWGDALCIVLDPYWYMEQRQGDNWRFTLGKKQYDWLKNTLESSHARFKFVFCHQILGGLESQGRGGARYAPFYEMGGLNADSSWGFTAQRPDWEMPLHQLLVQNRVAIFFHGHDHFYAREEREGVIYQLVPQPGYPGDKSAGKAAEYGYHSGLVLPGTGYLRVTVSETAATVDFVRSLLPAMESAVEKNGTIAASYTIPASGMTGAALPAMVPAAFTLEQNYPNPFNPGTTIAFTLAASGRARLQVLNTAGQCIVPLLDEFKSAGRHMVTFNAASLPSGLYFCRLITANGTAVNKMLCLH